MKVYFLSAQPCALSLNGAFFGVCDHFERFAEVSLSDNVYAQFSPANAQPIGCFLSPEIRFNPPNGFEIYLLPDGLALYARDFPPRDFTLSVCAQERKDDMLVTLFKQGNLQLSIEKGGQLLVLPVANAFENAKISFAENFVLLHTKNRLALYSLTGKCVFNEEIVDFSIEKDTLNATMPLSNSLGRVAKCTFALQENECVRTNVSLIQVCDEKGNTDKESVENSLLPFAFFESVLLGVDYTPFLSPALVDKADSLLAFLGNFVAVAPTNKAGTIALVRRKKEGLYEVSHYAVEIKDGKIVDIKG